MSAYGDGTTLAATWGAASDVLEVTTAACPLPEPRPRRRPWPRGPIGCDQRPADLGRGGATRATYRVEVRVDGTDAWTVQTTTR